MPDICLLVSLFVSNFIRKNCLTDLYENFTADVSVVKEDLVKFWKSSVSSNL